MDKEELRKIAQKAREERMKELEGWTREKALEIYEKNYSKYVNLVEGPDTKLEYTIYVNKEDDIYVVSSYGERGVQRRLFYKHTEPEAYYYAIGEAAAIASERKREEPDDIDF